MKFVFAMGKSAKILFLAMLGAGMCWYPGAGQAQSRHHTLTVVITHTLPATGQMKVAVFNSAATFLKAPLIKKQTEVGSEGKTIVNFEDLPAGDYAVSVIHDQNADGKLDRNFIGKPREPFGFSNNVRIKFAPPAFDKAKFTVDEKDQTIFIDLKS